jgi:hypothetical protein
MDNTKFEETIDGGFNLQGEHFIPMFNSPSTNRFALVWEKYPQLFYTSFDGTILSRHPNIVGEGYHGEHVLTIQLGINFQSAEESDENGQDWEGEEIILPKFTDDGKLYGLRWKFYNKKNFLDHIAANPVDMNHMLSAINQDYLKIVEALHICYIPIKEIQLTSATFPNLSDVSLINCGLTHFPNALSNLNLSYLHLRYNRDLVEIPYHFLKFRAIHLFWFDLMYTGVKCLWLPGSVWSHNRFDKDVWNGSSPMRQLVRIEEKQYEDANWEIDTECGTWKGLLEVIYKKSAAPVIRAAAAILGIHRRRVIPNFQKDIARLIARMILTTKGSAVWSELALREPTESPVFDYPEETNTFLYTRGEEVVLKKQKTE